MLWKVWKTWTPLNGKAAFSELQGLLEKPDFTLQSEGKNFELKRLWQKVQNEVYYVLCFSIIRVIQMYPSLKWGEMFFCIVQPVLVSSCIVYIAQSDRDTEGKSFWGCEPQVWSSVIPSAVSVHVHSRACSRSFRQLELFLLMTLYLGTATDIEGLCTKRKFPKHNFIWSSYFI